MSCHPARRRVFRRRGVLAANPLREIGLLTAHSPIQSRPARTPPLFYPSTRWPVRFLGKPAPLAPEDPCRQGARDCRTGSLPRVPHTDAPVPRGRPAASQRGPFTRIPPDPLTASYHAGSLPAGFPSFPACPDTPADSTDRYHRVVRVRQSHIRACILRHAAQDDPETLDGFAGGRAPAPAHPACRSR